AERGRLIHALFERLPAIAPGARRAAADRWLAQAGGVTDVAMRDDIVATVLAILDDPRLADLFGPDALAEAPIAAVVEGGVVVSGTVDRLLVGPEHIALVDFKTGRAVPPTLDDVPVYHVRQMAAYRAALAAIFPGRTIAPMLLYTSGPTLFELPEELLDAHKPGFVPEQQSFDMPA
ncbi:PD-(D/E)XK nuclease family protein, partial [Sphingomonas sp. AR_OL41]|uniref:PD-(D/E)XK nuclease family protein n=1 Tax=Sphingomonas sp. AR_OL41 TaxID=3042729 RepID=UPI0024802A7F